MGLHFLLSLLILLVNLELQTHLVHESKKRVCLVFVVLRSIKNDYEAAILDLGLQKIIFVGGVKIYDALQMASKGEG